MSSSVHRHALILFYHFN
uniref:Uncharacterized protein n=1 Tax=Anguilla anguilla TaxID=7936 RepID=A0A0E9TJ97_ANGAN